MSANFAKIAMPPRLSRLLVALALMFAGGAASAQDDPQGDGRRVALVIGNEAYEQARVVNGSEGARAVAEVLVQGGFKVLHLENAWRDDIRQALVTFAQSLKRGANGIVFFSGHAVQLQGRNYLVALDSKIRGPEDVAREAIDVDLFLDPLLLARTPGSVVILDAARANPWQALLPGALRGLADPEPLRGIAFVFPAAPGKVVNPAPKAGGVFAAQLAQAMKTPDLSFNDAVNRAREAVARINGQDQVIWQSDPAPADLVIIASAGPGGAQTAEARPVEARPADTRPADARTADAVETRFWDTVRNSSATSDYQAYLNAYPNGQFVTAARAKIALLQAKPLEAAPKPNTAAQPKPPELPATGQPKPPELPGTRQTAATRPEQIPTVAPTVPVAPTPPAAAAPPMAAQARDCALCPELVLIPAGTMTMGAKDGLPFETPVHEVAIAKPFYMGRREVTFDEWDACYAEGGCLYRPGDRGQGRGMRPVSDIDWNDAKAYVAWLSRKTGKTYRLPTEAEWEYAARAGSKTAFYWGALIDKDQANCAGCGAKAANNTVATGSFPPNAFGLLDIAGNAAEWVEDCWDDSYKSAPKDGTAFSKPDCRERVLRGGAFNNDQRFVRTAARFKYDHDVRYYANGFRVARER